MGTIKLFSATLGLGTLSFLLLGCASTGGPPPTPTPTPATAQLQWLGQSTFLLTSSQGTKVLIDPASPQTGYPVEPISGVDAITIGHEHGDHNYVAMAQGSPLVLRGLTATGWNTIDQKVKDIAIRSVPTYHDDKQGAQRGRNTVFIFEVDGLRLVHLSDLGHLLTPEQVSAIGTADVVLIPVGGFYTVDALAATQVVGQLSPRIVIPMHYKTPRMRAAWPGGGVEPFLEGKTVQRLDRNDINVIKLSKSTLPAQTTVVVLNYE